MSDEEFMIKGRTVGEGNFSIGSSVKGGLISVKIDVNDEAKSLEVMRKATQLLEQMTNAQTMRGLLQ
jgi:hypothetical protein